MTTLQEKITKAKELLAKKLEADGLEHINRRQCTQMLIDELDVSVNFAHATVLNFWRAQNISARSVKPRSPLRIIAEFFDGPLPP